MSYKLPSELFFIETSKRQSASATNVTLMDLTILTGTTGCRVWNNDSQNWDKTSCRVGYLFYIF